MNKVLGRRAAYYSKKTAGYLFSSVKLIIRIQFEWLSFVFLFCISQILLLLISLQIRKLAPQQIERLMSDLLNKYGVQSTLLFACLYKLNKTLNFNFRMLEVDFDAFPGSSPENIFTEVKPIKPRAYYAFFQQTHKSLVNFSGRAPEILFMALLMEKKPSKMAYFAIEQLIQSWAKVTLVGSNKNRYAYQLLTLGFQIGLDFTTEAGGLLVAAYLGGQAFESLATTLFDKFEKSSHFDKEQQKYSALLYKKALWQQAAYVVGAFLGKSLFCNASSFLLKPAKFEKTSALEPLHLSEYEDSLLANDRNCKRDHQACLETARKVLRLNPAENHNSSTIKKAGRKLSLFWHPDKNKEYDSITISREITQINNALKILRKN